MVRVSAEHLSSVWPILLMESIRVIEAPQLLQLLLAVCKFIDQALVLMPSLFHLWQWMFIDTTPFPASVPSASSSALTSTAALSTTSSTSSSFDPLAPSAQSSSSASASSTTGSSSSSSSSSCSSSFSSSSSSSSSSPVHFEPHLARLSDRIREAITSLRQRSGSPAPSPSANLSIFGSGTEDVNDPRSLLGLIDSSSSTPFSSASPYAASLGGRARGTQREPQVSPIDPS